jgi:putative membrane protein
MVKGHEEALALLDDKLIPAASSENARAHLTETRASVAEHLQRAKALQAQSNP